VRLPQEEPNSHNSVLYLITLISIYPNTVGLFQVVMSLLSPGNLLKTVHGQPRVHVTCRNIILLQATCASLSSDLCDPRCGRPCITLRSTETPEYYPKLGHESCLAYPVHRAFH
jgi:hypothetical protein